jgi:hypothetical protein
MSKSFKILDVYLIAAPDAPRTLQCVDHGSDVDDSYLRRRLLEFKCEWLSLTLTRKGKKLDI